MTEYVYFNFIKNCLFKTNLKKKFLYGRYLVEVVPDFGKKGIILTFHNKNEIIYLGEL